MIIPNISRLPFITLSKKHLPLDGRCFFILYESWWEHGEEYLILKCKKCRKTTFVLYREVDFNGFLVCSHCSSKSVKVVASTDDARECMGHAVYKREKGALKQIR